MARLVKFEVCGQVYTLNTDASEEDVREILDLVKSQIEVYAKSSKLLPAKLAVLASLNMAGKYVRLKKDFDNHKLMVEEKISTLTGQLEDSL